MVFISGAGTSALSSAVAAMRSGKDVDAELMAEIYTKAMMSGTFDLVLGKLFAFAEPKPITKSIGYTVDKSVAKYYAKTFRFDLDPAKVAEIAPNTAPNIPLIAASSQLPPAIFVAAALTVPPTPPNIRALVKTELLTETASTPPARAVPPER